MQRVPPRAVTTVIVPSPASVDTAPARANDARAFALGGQRPAPRDAAGGWPAPEALVAFAIGAAGCVYHRLGPWDLRTLENAGCRHARFESRAGQQLLMFVLDERAWIVFRGSNESVDWLLNFAVLPGTHPGFRWAWRRLRPAVEAWLDGLPEPPARHVLVGHSLGGAIATLAALTLAQARGFAIEAVITLGAPRVGSARFAQTYDAQAAHAGAPGATRTLGECTLRLVNSRDPVPHLPPALLGFAHVGRRHDAGPAASHKPAPVATIDPVTFRRHGSAGRDWADRLERALAQMRASLLVQYLFAVFWLARSALRHPSRAYAEPLGRTLPFCAFRPVPRQPSPGERLLAGVDVLGRLLIALLVLSPLLAAGGLLIYSANTGAWTLFVIELALVGLMAFTA